MVVEGGSETGFSDEMFEVNEVDKVLVRLLVYFLWVEVGTEVHLCD